MSGRRREDGWAEVLPDLETEEGETPADEEDVTDPQVPRPTLGADERPPAAFPEPSGATATEAPPPELSETDFLRTLETGAPESGRTGPRTADGTVHADANAGRFWREYRELILTATGCGVLLAGALWWAARDGSSPPRSDVASGSSDRADRTNPNDAPAEAAAGSGAPAAEARQRETEARGSQQPARASTEPAVPMLSIVTQPPGAMVEIDGVVYGRTPLIMQAPPNRDRFDVELRLDEHRTWSRVVTKDASGHFSVNAELEPFGP